MYRPLPSSFSNATTLYDVERTIRELTQDLATAFNTGNYDQAAAIFATDGQFMPPQHEPAHGPRPIERVFREYGEKGHQDLRMETLRIEHSTDLAVEIGRYTIAMSQANGTTVADRGKYITAWRRLGSWLIVAHCWNSNLPPAG